MREDEVERRLTTILAADVVGFSAMMAADEAGTLAGVKAVQAEIIDPMAAARGGRVVKLMGDGVLMDFGSVVDAVSFAVEMQQAVAARNAGLPENRHMTYRVGVNIGDVIVDGDDIYGDGVNVAARLEALADPGGICVSRTVFDHVKGKTRFGFEDLGDQRVKNIPEPVRIYRVTPDAAAPARPRRRTDQHRARRVALGAAAVLLALGALAFWLRPWAPQEIPASMARMAFPLPDKPSIAVLPFDDFSEDAGQGFFADGLTEDLITDLSKISGLFVIARNSSFAFRDQAIGPGEAAERLGVRYVLEGSVRRAGERLRVNAQLVDATTGGHVWADRFDGELSDIFAVQDQFVLKIVKALELRLTESERGELARSETSIIDAKTSFQQGWELYSRFNAADNARAVAHFEKAIELDPDYGRAYAALALVYLRGSIFHWDREMGESRARLYRELTPKYLNKASERPTALVHVVRAMQHLFYRHQAEPQGPNRGTDDARIEAGRAIALQPNDPEAHVMMAWALIAAGKPEEGLSFLRAAMRLNPNYPSHYVFFDAAARYAEGDMAAAAGILEEGLARDPRALELLPMAASVRAHLGRRAEAREVMLRWRPGEDAEALGRAAGEYTFPIQWVEAHEDLNIRLRDGLLLAALPLETTVGTLTADIGRADAEGRVRAARRLGWFGPEAAPAVPELIAMFGGAERPVRREAAITLGKIGPGAKAAIPALEAAIDEPIVGFHVRAALDRINGR